MAKISLKNLNSFLSYLEKLEGVVISDPPTLSSLRVYRSSFKNKSTGVGHSLLLL